MVERRYRKRFRSGGLRLVIAAAVIAHDFSDGINTVSFIVRGGGSWQRALPWLLAHVEEAWRVFGTDFWSYGLEPNRPTLAALGRFVHEQSLCPRPVSPDELFAPGVE